MIRLINTENEILDDIPKVVYKYRTWQSATHKALLKKGSIYFAAPDSFEDTYDCNLPEKFPQGSDLFHYFYKISIDKNSQFTEKEHIEFANYWCQHSPLNNPKEKNKLLKYFRNLFSKTHGVLSLCKSADNEKMWEKYGDNHKGYCVGLSLPILSKYCNGGGEVDYQENVPTIDYLNDTRDEKIRKQLFSKQKIYSYEDEYRLLKINNNKALSNSDRTLILPINCLQAVYLGKSMLQDDKNEIKTIVKYRYPNAIIVEL